MAVYRLAREVCVKLETGSPDPSRCLRVTAPGMGVLRTLISAGEPPPATRSAIHAAGRANPSHRSGRPAAQRPPPPQPPRDAGEVARRGSAGPRARQRPPAARQEGRGSGRRDSAGTAETRRAAAARSCGRRRAFRLALPPLRAGGPFAGRRRDCRDLGPGVVVPSRRRLPVVGAATIPSKSESSESLRVGLPVSRVFGCPRAPRGLARACRRAWDKACIKMSDPCAS